MIDYHMHSRLCRHGSGEIYEYVESAIEKGLTEIGFAEHIPIPDLDDPTGRMVIDDWDVYVRDVSEAQARYPEIKIRFGLEADYLPAHMAFIEKFVADYPFDYVIGSVHFIEDWDFSNPAHRFRLPEFGLETLHRTYYDLIVEAAETGLYDIIGHFDLPKRVGSVDWAVVDEKVDRALSAIRQHDLALDINTSGLRKEPREIYPSNKILEQAFKRGIVIALGSDAHKPDEVAADFDTTIALVKNVGYNQISIFEGRQRKLTALENV